MMSNLKMVNRLLNQITGAPPNSPYTRFDNNSWRTRLHKDGHIKLSRGQKELVTFKPVVPDPEDITTVATAVSAEKDSQNQVKTEIELKLPGNVQLIMRSYQS